MKKLVLVCAALVLTACSAQPEGGGEEVASLSTPAGDTASTAAEQERPRERLDMTVEDIEALGAPYQRCLDEHGLSKGGTEPPPEVVDEALTACESLRPLPPWEKDATNPEALDFASRVVQCLRDKGVRYVEVHQDPDSEEVGLSFGGPNNDQQSITLGLRHQRECELAASK